MPTQTATAKGGQANRKESCQTSRLTPPAHRGTVSRLPSLYTQNRYFNGHPDLIVSGRYPNNKVKSGVDGVEIKTTRKKGGAVDTHDARDQWMRAFVNETDHHTEVVQHIRGRLRVMSFAELVPKLTQ